MNIYELLIVYPMLGLIGLAVCVGAFEAGRMMREDAERQQAQTREREPEPEFEGLSAAQLRRTTRQAMHYDMKRGKRARSGYRRHRRVEMG